MPTALAVQWWPLWPLSGPGTIVPGLGGSSDAAAQNTARRAVRGIARLKVNRSEFDQQARALQSTNVVYKDRGKIFIGMKISVWISVACILNPM